MATYAKAQANIADGGGGGGGGASRACCAGAQIDGIVPPERGQPTSPVAFNVSSIARYAGAAQRSEGPPRAPTVPVLSYSQMIFHTKTSFADHVLENLFSNTQEKGPLALSATETTAGNKPGKTTANKGRPR